MALKPIYIFFARRWTDAEWQNATNESEYRTAEQTVLLAAEELGLDANDGSMFAYRVTGDEVDSMLSLGRVQLPQLLFSTPIDPNDPSKGVMFLAKLVQGQITRKNVVTMLKTVRQLEPKLDPSGTVTFYNPSLTLPAVGIPNTAGAPGGGYMIGLNPLSENLEVNRYGQQIQNFFNSLTKALPLILIGLAAYKLTEE
jgi:hypothetical protein